MKPVFILEVPKMGEFPGQKLLYFISRSTFLFAVHARKKCDHFYVRNSSDLDRRVDWCSPEKFMISGTNVK